MSLDVYLEEVKPTEVYGGNITHNLTKMAQEAGIYEALWRPDENYITEARHLIDPIEKGLAKLKADPEKFKKFNPENGWGNYENLVKFVERYLKACKEHPEASVGVSR